jgi:isoleucyl-tRNA synthetase
MIVSEKEVPDYKNTIKLPQTDFPMKGNLPQKEPEIIKFWEEKQIYQKLMKKNESKESFVLPDGPPYANGSIHIGHALNKVLKDIVIKYKNMKGFKSPFIPGWDCHGLPIEHKVMKELGDKAKIKTDTEIRTLCRAEALKWVDHQQVQFIRLGILADWKNRYLTMDKEYEAEEVREFARAYKKGVLYRGEKPVYWNWALQTALAETEVEYHMHRSPSIYVKFEVKDAESLERLRLQKKDKVYFVIWTTTPWTLPANLGICLHEEFKYTLFKTDGELFIIADGLKEFFEKETGKNLESTGRHWQGKELDRIKAHHPFIDRDSLVMLGPHVSLDAGTGCVHTAPGHGADDFKVGLQYGLPILSPVDEKGCYTAEFSELQGINIFKANPMIVEKLKSSGHLIALKEIEHSYPHCWRSKVPLIFRATPQWFIGLDLESNNIRNKALKALGEIKFFPDWGEARLRAMMENRPDWCLSRQRTWGVPIPVFYCKATGEPVLDEAVMMKVAEVMEKEKGIESFYEYPPEKFIPESLIKGKFGSEGFRHGKDILDVWFDSGICHAAVQRKREGMKVPADIYLEGSDQHRGWFNTSLLSSLVTNGIPPFKALITHGFVNDPEGKKMSKSKGNTVDPNETTAKSGAEIVRLWTVYEDYGQDLTCGPELFVRVSETYRRIRNTMRFLLGALSDFDPEKDQIPVVKMTKLDQWAMHETNKLIQNITKAYDNYEFYKVYHLLNSFFTITLSATYLDILKDRLYTWKADGLPRRSSQTVLFIILDSLVRLMAPVLSFLSEETYTYMKGKKQESVFLLDFPRVQNEWNFPELAEEYQVLLNLRETAAKELELLRAAKTIGSSLEAQLTLSVDDKVWPVVKKFEGELKEFFIVSKVNIEKGQAKVTAQKAEGEKCIRCWNYDLKTGTNEKFVGVCPKCVEALL